MQCRYCGAALVSGALFCPNCGKPVASSSSNSEFSSYEYNSNDQPALSPPATPPVETPAPPSSPGQSSYTGQQQPAQVAQEAQGAQQYGPNPQAPVYPVQQPGFNPPAPMYPGQQFGTPVYPPTQPYASPQFYQGMMPVNQGSFPPPSTMPVQPGPGFPPSLTPPKKRGLSTAMVVLFVLLAALVGAGGVLAYYAISHRSTTVGPTTIATTTTGTTQAASTVTTSDPVQLYSQATRGTPTLNDPLNASNPNGWEPIGTGSSCMFSGKSLDLSATAAGSGQPTVGICLAIATNFDNFAYLVNTSVSKGNITGVVFRADPFAKGLYLFGINTSGAYVLASDQTDSTGKTNFKQLAEGVSQAIKTGANQANLLAVIARGSTLNLYANQQYLTSVDDSTTSGGVIGIFGEDSQGGAAQVSFTSIKVWQLQG